MTLERKPRTRYRIGSPKYGEVYHLRISDHILDNIYGQIGLTDLEKNIERLAIFKRLHSISQLGLVNWVFPCALHTRYTHSIGVMHIAGIMAEHINQNISKDTGINSFFDDNDIQIIRLAGILHDIGHYPMSHNIEQAYEYARKKKDDESNYVLDNLSFYVNCPKYLMPYPLTNDVGTNKNDRFHDKFSGSRGLHHECVGQEIILKNKDIFEVVKWYFVLLPSHDNSEWVVNPKFVSSSTKKYLTDEAVNKIVRTLMADVGNIVIGNYKRDDATQPWDEKYSAMVQLIHSELDADNRDYLLRDATFSGTSYGVMDMSVLLNSLTAARFTYRKNGVEHSRYIVGVKRKGTGCVEQFLLNKFLAYTQMIFNKYTSILEAMLLQFAMGSVDVHDNHYNKDNILNVAGDANTSLDYLRFSDYYIISEIFQADRQSHNMTLFPKASISRLKHSCAFDLQDGVSECICTGISNDDIKAEMQKSQVFKRFLRKCKKLKGVTGIDLHENGALESKLLAFRFEEYTLTKQIPLEAYLKSIETKCDLTWYDYQYFRLGEGIPVLESGKEYICSGRTSLRDCRKSFPPLCVDFVQSSLHKIYNMRYVSLREYKIEEYFAS